MNKLIVFIVSIQALQTFGQVTEDFSDGDFSNNPTWFVQSASDWLVNNGRLQSNVSVTNSSFQIVTASAKAQNARWEFWLNLQFNTSGANFVDVFLTASDAALTAPANNGYFVRIGNTADEISLYKKVGTTTSLLIDGTNGVTNRSNNTLRIKVVRSGDGLWTLERDASGGTNYVLEGTVTDNEITQSMYFGISVRQSTASFFNKHFFDDIYVGAIAAERDPPQIASVLATTDSTITVSFNERVEAGSATSSDNYLVEGLGHPASIDITNGDSAVVLNFIQRFMNGLEYTLQVAGINDLAGNTLAPVAITVRYFVSTPPNAFDVVFNELLPDPSPSVGLPSAEFIEIFNRSSNPFDLGGWTLRDGTSTAVFPGFILMPASYLIITAGSAGDSFSTYGSVVGLSNFPTLNNSADILMLADADGNTIDSVSYTLSWYRDEDKAQGGWSLERLNPPVETNDPLNWIASEDDSGGTPGRQNSVFGRNPDAVAPVLIDVAATSQTEVTLIFSEQLATSSINSSNFFIKGIGNALNAILAGAGETITTTFSPLVNGQSYEIIVSNIADLAGNVMDTSAASFLYFVPTPVQQKDVRISEIMADPSPVVQLPESEFVELFNAASYPINLQGWQLTDGSSVATLPFAIIQPGEYAVVVAAARVDQFRAFGRVIGVSNFPSLNNTEDLVMLRLGSLAVDLVFYADRWYKDDEKRDGGWSLERIDLANICSEEDNWAASEDDRGGTPGMINSIAASNPDLSGPRMIRATVQNDSTLLIAFNEKLEKQLSADGFNLNPAVAITSATFTNSALREIKLQLVDRLQSTTLYTISANGIADCAGNPIDAAFNSLQFALPEPALQQDVVINEVLFNPRPGGVDFVELYNRSDKFFNLKGWTLANKADNTLDNVETLTMNDLLLGPSGYMVIAEDTAVLKDQYPRSVVRTFYQTDLPPLNDDGGTLLVADSSGSEIDFLSYSEDYHSPLLRNVEGVSLERVSTEVSADEVANWKSSTAAEGYATPGYRNANALPDVNTVSGEVEIEPVVFKAGNGFASIKYSFDKAGLVANVKIFDQQGREVKQVANNETLSFSGFYTWDGDGAEGAQARAGYYFVWFEVFDPDGGVRTFRKRVVLLAN